MPECDVCVSEGVSDPNEAVWDAPLREIGTWAYLCRDHKHLGDLGAAIHLRPHPEEQPDSETVKSVSIPLTLDSVVTVECPTCGHPRRAEPDARYTVTCEDCGQRYKLESQL